MAQIERVIDLAKEAVSDTYKINLLSAMNVLPCVRNELP